MTPARVPAILQVMLFALVACGSGGEQANENDRIAAAQAAYCDSIRQAVEQGERIGNGLDLPEDALPVLRDLQLKMEEAEEILRGTSTPPAPPGKRTASSYVASARSGLAAEDDTYQLGEYTLSRKGAVARSLTSFEDSLELTDC